MILCSNHTVWSDPKEKRVESSMESFRSLNCMWIALNRCRNWRNCVIPVIPGSRLLIHAWLPCFLHFDSSVFCVNAETGQPAWGCDPVSKNGPLRACFVFIFLLTLESYYLTLSLTFTLTHLLQLYFYFSQPPILFDILYLF